MCADQQNHFRVCVIGTGPIESHPELITFACARRTDVRVRVVTVDTPRGKNALRESIFTGTPDVIHDFVFAIFDYRFTNSRSEIVEDCIPTHLLPVSLAAFADP